MIVLILIILRTGVGFYKHWSSLNPFRFDEAGSFLSALEPQVKLSMRTNEHEASSSQMTYQNYLALSGSLS